MQAQHASVGLKSFLIQVFTDKVYTNYNKLGAPPLCGYFLDVCSQGKSNVLATWVGDYDNTVGFCSCVQNFYKPILVTLMLSVMPLPQHVIFRRAIAVSVVTADNSEMVAATC